VCEIVNTHLFDLYRNRHCHSLRHGRGVSIRKHPADYEDTKRGVFVFADTANRRTEDYLDELNGQRGVGELVRPGELHQGVRTGNHVKSSTPGRQRDDVRPVDYREEWRAAETRQQACKREECKDWGHRNSCLDRQWAGKCPAFPGRNL